MASGQVVAFRVDASVSIGTGHVMRCLTLAHILAARGAACHFISRALGGNLLPLIRERGFDCHVLDRAAEVEDDKATAHSDWLTVSGERDAKETLAILERLRPDWIVQDHYALDAAWERAVRPSGIRLMVIDDLADRPHECDILLDQNVGRSEGDYAGLLPENCSLLVGTDFALLRPEFARLRSESLRRRADGALRRILVSLGGIDKDNATLRVLDALARQTLSAGCSITIVLGRNAPWKDDVGRRAETMPVPTVIKVDAENVAWLMAEADVAVGAAGSSALERCCMGLPTLMVSLASNQNRIAACLDHAGAARYLGDPFADDFESRLGRELGELLAAPDVLRSQQLESARLVDGLGAQRVADALLSYGYSVRRAVGVDAAKVYAWRYDGDAAELYRNKEVPTLERHLSWFAEALEDERRHLLFVGRDGADVAHVRFDRDEADPAAAWVSICLDPGQRGTGQSTNILQVAIDHGRALGFGTYLAEVHVSNASSRRLFEKLGFRRSGQDGPFRRYTLELGLAPGDRA